MLLLTYKYTNKYGDLLLNQLKNMAYFDNKSQLSELVNDSLLDNLVRLGPQVLFSSILVASIFYLVALESLDFTYLTAWFVINVALTAVRLIRIKNIRLHSDRTQSQSISYQREYIFGALLSGLSWASIALFFNSDLSVTIQLFILILLVGLPVSSLSTNANHISVFIAFALPIFVALIYSSFKIEDNNLFFFLMALVHIVITFITSFRLNRTMQENVRSHLLNQELVEEVTRVNSELETLAYFDSLTRLYNRRHFKESAEKQLATLNSQSEPLVVFMVDVDKFKHVNDTYGHEAGDLLLQHIANSIQVSFEHLPDVTYSKLEVSRLGGDEFVVMLRCSNEERVLNHIAENMLKFIHTEIRFANVLYQPQVSIGISTATVKASRLSVLLKHADTAMYKVKHSGGNNYFICTMDKEVA